MKKLILILSLFLVGTFAVFGGNTDFSLSELQTSLEKLIDFFTSNIMRAIFAIALAALLVGLGLKREDPELKKRFLFWVVAIGGLLGLSQIMDVFFTSGALL